MCIFEVNYLITLLLLAVVRSGAEAKTVEINLIVNDNGTKCSAKTTPIVYETVSLDLIVPIELSDARCWKFIDKYYYDITVHLERYAEGAKITLKEPVYDYSSYECRLTRGDKLGEVDCIFDIIIGGYMKISTNDVTLNMTAADSSVSEYEAVATYNYQDGEMVDTTCTLSHHLHRHAGLLVHMEYHDANGKTLFESGSQYLWRLNFRSVMRLERNHSYLDCHCHVENVQVITYRTYYIWHPRSNTAVTVWVDDVELIPRHVLSTSDTKLQYQTYYIEGQSVNLKCKLTNEFTEINVSRIIDYTFTERCFNKQEKYSVAIDFKSELGKWNLDKTRIVGLRADKILYQYKSGSYEWTIHYQYTNNETLKLTCVTKWLGNRKLQWVYPNKLLLNVSDNVVPNNYNIITFNATITLSDADNMSKIECRRVNQKDNRIDSKVVIILHALPPTTTTPRLTEYGKTTTEGYNEWTTSITMSSTDTSAITITPTKSGKGGGNVSLIIGVSVSAMVVILLLSGWWYIHKKPIRRNENCCLSEDAPIQTFPPQWNDNAGCDTVNTDTDEGIMVENNYYEAHNNDTNDSVYYAEISPQTFGSGSGQIGTETLYAQVDKKSKVRNVLGNGRYGNTAGSDHYANLGHNIGKEERHYENIVI